MAHAKITPYLSPNDEEPYYPDDSDQVQELADEIVTDWLTDADKINHYSAEFEPEEWMRINRAIANDDCLELMLSFRISLRVHMTADARIEAMRGLDRERENERKYRGEPV